MAFWLNEAITSEPKRNFRWYMVFGGSKSVGLDDFTYALKKVDLPKASIKEAEHQYLNHKFYYPGRLEWNTINITMASVTNSDAGAALYRALQEAGYGPPSAPAAPAATAATAAAVDNPRSTMSKKAFSNAIGGEIEIKQINSDGQVLNSFKLFNPFFTEVSWGSLDYTSEDITELSLTVRYDYASYIVVNGTFTETTARPGLTVPTI